MSKLIIFFSKIKKENALIKIGLEHKYMMNKIQAHRTLKTTTQQMVVMDRKPIIETQTKKKV